MIRVFLLHVTYVIPANGKFLQGIEPPSVNRIIYCSWPIILISRCYYPPFGSRKIVDP